MEVTLHAGEKRTGVTVPMVRRQMVCGRVTENGVPLKRPTWVLAYRYDKGTGEISRSALPATEPDGTYRFDDLTPGTYYLQGATTWYPGSSASSSEAGRREQQEPRSSWSAERKFEI